MKALALSCPACAAALEVLEHGDARCSACGRTYAQTGGVLDLRVDANKASDSWPLRAEQLEQCLRDLASGTPFRQALEALLYTCDGAEADRLMQILREARGAWLTQLASRGGSALFLGNALSGTPIPLGACGFEVTFLEPSPLRARLGAAHKEALEPGCTRALVGGDGPRLPFADRSFDVVVQEDGLPRADAGWGHDVSELERVCAGELFLVANNRLGYKRSSGLRGIFKLPTPWGYAREAVLPRRGERTLAGYRKALQAPGFEPAAAYALYPHANDFTFMVGLDGHGPELLVGPMERKNKAKIIAQRAGLFSLLTPSFGLVARRRELRDAPLRADVLLAELARRIGEPRPELDQLVATRGNTSVLFTALPGRGEEHPPGRWCIHIPLSPAQRKQIVRHHGVLLALRERWPRVLVPEPLFEGVIDGIYLSCERRVEGYNATQYTGDQRLAPRILADVVDGLAQLVVEPARPCDERRFAEQIERRLAPVERKAHVPATIAAVARVRAQLRSRLIGRTFPLVLSHQDLRSKHLQVRPDGSLAAFLDFGSSEDTGLPCFDLMNHLLHERKQEADLQPAEAWRLVREPKLLRAHEREALQEYARRLELDDEYCQAIADALPFLVAAMAEANWDYSRPAWLHRQFGV